MKPPMKRLPALAALAVTFAGPVAATTEYDCSNVCQPDTPCHQDCVIGSLLTTCSDYGVCSSPPPPLSCTADVCMGNACGVFPFDADCDGVPEQLEYDLAHRFFPNVRLQHTVPDVDQAYLRLGRATPYTVQPLLPLRHRCNEPYECLEIRYGIAFKNDCGDFLPGESTSHCDNSAWFPNYGHIGDSEFYVALVQRTAPWSQAQSASWQWVLIRDFTSAHWEDSGESSMIGAYGDQPPGCFDWWSEDLCRQYPSQCGWMTEFCTGTPVNQGYWQCSDQWSYESCESIAGCLWIGGCYPRAKIRQYLPSPLSGPATIFASEGKHALYHTDGECDNGGYDIPLFPDDPADHCPRDPNNYPSTHNLRNYKGNLLQNVGWVSDGTDGQNSNCASRDTIIQHPNWCDLYDVWSGNHFAGSSDYRGKFHHDFDWALPPF